MEAEMEKREVKFRCAKCGENPERVTQTRDPVLLRYQIVAECHGEVETISIFESELKPIYTFFSNKK
jgi:hypothetical protein